MKKSAEIIKSHKGSDRRFKLKELRAAYDSRMKGAPKPSGGVRRLVQTR
jgi:hypothetical protein